MRRSGPFAVALAFAFACGGGEGAAPVAAGSGDASASADGGATASDTGTSGEVGTDAPTPPVPGTPPAPFGCVSDVSAGHHVFDCGGVRYDVEVSPACAKGGCGIVVDVHGLTMNGDQEDASTGLRAVAAARGYVVVQPTAPSGLLGPSWTPGADDDKVWGFLGEARQAFVVDPKRVHVTGFSQGGAMSFRLLCKHASEIASAAPIASADAQSLDSNTPPFRLDCPFDAVTSPSRPLSILMMHGTKDGLVPIAKGRQQRDAILAWMGATTKATVANADGVSHERFTAASGNVLEVIEHEYAVPTPPVPLPIAVGGHCFPGGKDLTRSATRPLIFSCEPPNAFVWGTLVTDFFAAHPMP